MAKSSVASMMAAAAATAPPALALSEIAAAGYSHSHKAISSNVGDQQADTITTSASSNTMTDSYEQQRQPSQVIVMFRDELPTKERDYCTEISADDRPKLLKDLVGTFQMKGYKARVFSFDHGGFSNQTKPKPTKRLSDACSTVATAPETDTEDDATSVVSASASSPSSASASLTPTYTHSKHVVAEDWVKVSRSRCLTLNKPAPVSPLSSPAYMPAYINPSSFRLPTSMSPVKLFKSKKGTRRKMNARFRDALKMPLFQDQHDDEDEKTIHKPRPISEDWVSVRRQSGVKTHGRDEDDESISVSTQDSSEEPLTPIRSLPLHSTHLDTIEELADDPMTPIRETSASLKMPSLEHDSSRLPHDSQRDDEGSQRSISNDWIRIRHSVDAESVSVDSKDPANSQQQQQVSPIRSRAIDFETAQVKSPLSETPQNSSSTLSFSNRNMRHLTEEETTTAANSLPALDRSKLSSASEREGKENLPIFDWIRLHSEKQLQRQKQDSMPLDWIRLPSAKEIRRQDEDRIEHAMEEVSSSLLSPHALEASTTKNRKDNDRWVRVSSSSGASTTSTTASPASSDSYYAPLNDSGTHDNDNSVSFYEETVHDGDSYDGDEHVGGLSVKRGSMIIVRDGSVVSDFTAIAEEREVVDEHGQVWIEQVIDSDDDDDGTIDTMEYRDDVESGYESGNSLWTEEEVLEDDSNSEYTEELIDDKEDFAGDGKESATSELRDDIHGASWVLLQNHSMVSDMTGSFDDDGDGSVQGGSVEDNVRAPWTFAEPSSFPAFMSDDMELVQDDDDNEDEEDNPSSGSCRF